MSRKSVILLVHVSLLMVTLTVPVLCMHVLPTSQYIFIHAVLLELLELWLLRKPN